MPGCRARHAGHLPPTPGSPPVHPLDLIHLQPGDVLCTCAPRDVAGEWVHRRGCGIPYEELVAVVDEQDAP